MPKKELYVERREEGDYCPCGIEAHDPGALKKHRARFQKSIARNILGDP